MGGVGTGSSCSSYNNHRSSQKNARLFRFLNANNQEYLKKLILLRKLKTSPCLFENKYPDRECF